MKEPFEIKKQIDLLKEEKLRLKNENSTLKSQREILQRERDLVQQVLTESRDKIHHYNSLVDGIATDLDEFIKEKAAILREGIESVRLSRQIVEEYRQFLEDLGIKVDENVKDLGEFKKSQQEIHESIVKENAELLKSRDDLNIYKKRLEKKYQEVMPDQKIIL